MFAKLCVLIVLISPVTAHADELIHVNYDSNPQLIGLGEGLTPTWSRGAPCFSYASEFQRNADAKYYISVSDSDHSQSSLETSAESGSFSAGFDVGYGGGAAALGVTQGRSQQYERDDRSLSVIVDFDVVVGREHITSLSLTKLGKDILAQGAVEFVRKCGVLQSADITKSVKHVPKLT